MSTIAKLYGKFRTKGGMDAKAALRAAKILERWQAAECGEHDEPEIGSVRLVCEPEDEPYDAGDCRDAYTNIYGRRVSAEYFDGEDWQSADSIGGCAGYEDVLSPFENWYVVDLMDSALDAVEHLTPEYAI